MVEDITFPGKKCFGAVDAYQYHQSSKLYRYERQYNNLRVNNIEFIDNLKLDNIMRIGES